MKFLYHKNLKNISNFLFISEQEKEIGKSLFPRLKPHIIGYGISLDDFNFISDKKLTPVLGYIGNYLHLPNKDAVEHFISEIFPIIVRDIPQVSVVIAGKNMPDSWFLPNHHPPSIAFVKDVENLNYFYRDIDIFINPIISGRGMRTKLIESAACGVPIVSTKLGAEGLDNLKIELAETGKDFSDKIKRLYLNKKLYSEIALNNRTCVEKNYSIDFVGKMLELILQE